MKASHGWMALLLAGAGLSARAQPPALVDADLLYCAQVYGEVATTFSSSGGEAAEAARDALQRSRPLSARDNDLLNDDPARYSRASAAAGRRLALLPDAPGRARTAALRAAYEECRGLEDRVASSATPSDSGNRVQLLANRHFCRELLQRTLTISPGVRAALKPSERTALDESRRIADALAQPLPGPAPTPAQDREARALKAQLRTTLDLAVAHWDSGRDPVVQAMGQCYDAYAQGLLGGPDVLSPADDAAAGDSMVAATATVAAPSSPVVQPADLGPVFHMRENTPAGNFEGIWVRRGRSGLYDAFWVNVANGLMQRDVLELHGIVDGELSLYRQSYRGHYRARVRADGTLAPGVASWFDSPAYSWGALPPQNVRTATGDLGAIVHMREVTPYGNYEGIWRQRGQTGVYDALWVFLPSGELSSDVLGVAGVARGQLIIRRQKGPGLFPVKRRTDSMRYRDAARGGTTASRWVVVPAQPVRLGSAPR